MKTIKRMTGLGPLALVAFVLAAPRPAAADAHITVINADGPNEGFNDSTPVAPVGGNPGTTKGQQRLIAFQFAADLWGAALDSNVDINIRASFDPLGPNVLGAAAAAFSIRNFNVLAAPGFPGGAPDTNYHGALADKRAGVDLADVLGLGASFPEIIAQFSSDFDFYLGLDNNHGANNDLVVTLLHEFGHGLGFSSFMSRTTGNTPGGATDPFLNNALDGSTNTTLASLLASSAAVRLATIQKVDQIVWTGANVAAGVPTTLLFGRPELFVPQLASIDGSRYGTAAFGPPITANGISGFVVVAQDGVGVSSDACEPLTPANAVVVQGKIALVDRGTCTFVVKVKNAQNAGAIAVLVADNVADNPPAGLGGVDPTITISSARVLRATGDAIKAVLATGPLIITIALNQSRRAGTDLQDRPQLYASVPIASGSTLNHWDPIAFRNLLMEPAVNPDLTHNLIPPFDTTLPQMHDMGWFTDANLDGTEDATAIVNSCDTGLKDVFIGNGALLSDQARAWFLQCKKTTSDTLTFDACFDGAVKDAKQAGIIDGEQSAFLRLCAQFRGKPTN
jgi:hypothetical protein